MADHDDQRPLDPFQDRADAAVLRYKGQRLEETVKVLHDELGKIEARNEVRDAERAAEKQRTLVWGISVLGFFVTTLGGIVWANLSAIIKGSP